MHSVLGVVTRLMSSFIIQDMSASASGNDMEESGWKMVSGDVFRPPKNAIHLCVQIGSGVQIITSAFATLFFAALGESSFSNGAFAQCEVPLMACSFEHAYQRSPLGANTCISTSCV